MRLLDRLALAGMAVGTLLILQPWWAVGFRAGFFVLLVSTVLYIVTSHCGDSPVREHGGRPRGGGR